jgi:hypothetical protein
MLLPLYAPGKKYIHRTHWMYSRASPDAVEKNANFLFLQAIFQSALTAVLSCPTFL